MFDRWLYKKKALEALKGRWRIPVLLTLVTGLLVSCLMLPALRGVTADVDTHTRYGNVHASSISAVLTTVPTPLALVAIAATGVLALANTTVYLRLSRTLGKADFNTFLGGLEHWRTGALGALWFSLWTMLWSLLFIIPGIVKALAYSQMFFVLAENPQISARKAMHISKILTQGHKADLFVQAVSFFGWALLCNLTCGVGYLWLIPYMQQTFTYSYTALKNESLASGRLYPADFAA